jgi:long-subunit acyl-CoA synthetase (AMP-forming)
VEGYGLAEAGPMIALSNPRITRSGTVGLPLAGGGEGIGERRRGSDQFAPGPCGSAGVARPHFRQRDGLRRRDGRAPWTAPTSSPRC